MRKKSNSRPRRWVDQVLKKPRTNGSVGVRVVERDASGRGHIWNHFLTRAGKTEGGMTGGTRCMGGVTQPLEDHEAVSESYRGP